MSKLSKIFVASVSLYAVTLESVELSENCVASLELFAAPLICSTLSKI